MIRPDLKLNTIDEYIAGFPARIQILLEKMRAAIKKAAPDAEETISYQIPTFKLNGNLVHFAAFTNHIGFYPTSSGVKNFQKELSAYKSAKGSVQFPFDKPLPLDLVTEIVKFRIKENLEKGKAKTLRTCIQGHTYYKSSDCPTCPVCEKERKPKDSFLSMLSAPARRALENAGITTIQKLSKYSESEILALHGVGPNTIPKLLKAMKSEGLSFKKI